MGEGEREGERGLPRQTHTLRLAGAPNKMRGGGRKGEREEKRERNERQKRERERRERERRA